MGTSWPTILTRFSTRRTLVTGFRSANEEKHDIITRVMRANYDFDLTLV